jgi:hypothetical protein
MSNKITGLKYSVKTNGNSRNIKRKKKDSIKYKKKSCPKEIFEFITGCKHPLIASGATTIGRASSAPDKINTGITKLGR